MPYFFCRVATEEGRVMSHSFLAPSKHDCRKHFEDQGFCILSIKRDWQRVQIPVLPFEKKIKDQDFIMFNQELVALIKAGYPILKSIEILKRRIKNVHLKEVLMKVENDIRAGKSLSESFSALSEQLSPVYIASLMAGERSGSLPDTIKRYIAYHKVMAKTKERIRRAMTYPSLLLLFSFILMSIIVYFIIPRFANFYTAFDSELPWITVTLMSFSNFVRKYSIFILLFLILLVIFTIRLRSREKSRIRIDQLKLYVPVLRKIWLDSAVALFSRTLGLLLEGGISLLPALGIARQAVPNKYLLLKMMDLPEKIKNGESLSDSLEEADFFDPLALDMIRIGESSANLEGMLSDVAEVYDERIQAKIDTFVTMIEPMVMIFMGLLVALMLLSVYLPIFNIISVTR